MLPENRKLLNHILANNDLYNPRKSETRNGDIIIQNNIFMCKNKCEHIITPFYLSVDDILIQQSEITAPTKDGGNPFWRPHTYFSVLEADGRKDKNSNCRVPFGHFKEVHNNIDFGKFMPIAIGNIAINHQIITFANYCHVFFEAYLEFVPEDEIGKIDYNLYFKRPFTGWDLSPIIFGDRKIENAVIRFKKELIENGSITGLPFNEFTIDIFLFRAYKSYFSCNRDILNIPLLYHYTGFNALYSYDLDMVGCDGILHDFYIRSTYGTIKADCFRLVKEKYRWQTDPNKIINMYASPSNDGKISLITEDVAIKLRNDILSNNYRTEKKDNAIHKILSCRY